MNGPNGMLVNGPTRGLDGPVMGRSQTRSLDRRFVNLKKGVTHFEKTSVAGAPAFNPAIGGRICFLRVGCEDGFGNVRSPGFAGRSCARNHGFERAIRDSNTKRNWDA